MKKTGDDPEDMGALFKSIHLASLELTRARTASDLYRQAVELGRKYLDMDRMGILLYDPLTSVCRGTWGTDEQGNTCDESSYESSTPEKDDFILKSLKQHDNVVVWENHALKNWDRNVGIGWNAMAILWDGDQAFGWIAADNLLRKKPMTPSKKEALGLYARIISNLILRLRYEENLKIEVQAKTAELRREQERLKNLYEEILEQDSAKKRLFTIFAHDLRGPLGSVRNLLDEACEDMESISADELKELLPEIRNSVSTSYNLVGNLLDWVRSQIQKSEIAFRRIPILKPVESAQDVIEPLAQRKHITMKIEGRYDMTIATDECLVETIVRNLMSNAVKFSQPGNTVNVTVSKSLEDGSGRITVADTGIGMDAETRSLLFTMQTHQKRTGTSGERGSGLGLMFCQEIAGKIGARIEAESTPGAGSVFTLILPDHPASTNPDQVIKPDDSV